MIQTSCYDLLNMKIIHVVPTMHNQSAGTTVYVENLAKNQKLRGDEVTVISLASFEQNITFSKIIDGVNYKVFARSKIFRRLGRSMEMLNYLKSNIKSFDVIHIHIMWMSPCYYPIIASESIGGLNENARIIFSPHGALTRYSRKRSKLKKFFSWIFWQRKVVENAHIVHVTSKIEEADFKEIFPHKIVKCVPIGVERYEVQPVVGEYFLYLSRIDPKKNLDKLIEYFDDPLLNASSLLVAGPREKGEYFSSVLKAISLRKNLKYIGPVFGEDKIRLLAGAKMLLLPSSSENFGIVIAEALAVGTPVLVTDSTPWSIVNTLNCGICCSINLYKENLLVAAKLSDNEIHEMSMNAKSYAEAAFAWTRIAEEMESIYASKY